MERASHNFASSRQLKLTYRMRLSRVSRLLEFVMEATAQLCESALQEQGASGKGVFEGLGTQGGGQRGGLPLHRQQGV